MSQEPTHAQQARIDLLSDVHDGHPLAIIADEDDDIVAVAQTGYCWHIDLNGNVTECHARHGHPIDWTRLDEDEGVAYRKRIWAVMSESLFPEEG